VTAPPEIPVLIFDGNCGFCRAWVDYCLSLTGSRVEYLPFQEAGERFPEVPVEDCRQAVQFVSGATRVSGAEAIFKLLSDVPGYGWMYVLYRTAPGLAFMAEFFYRVIARNRNAAAPVTRVLWGERILRPTYHKASEIFVRSLSVIYMIAFASFGMQARGLVGVQGILPVQTYFRFAKAQLGDGAFWRVPSLFWWSNGDFALLSIAWGGVALAAISILARPHSRWHKIIFGILFVYYLSIVSAGQIFMSYQWDFLLLETGFIAIFLQAARPRVWLFHWLLFRLMFESFLVKVMSHDPSWANFTALAFHYETQPLPTFLAWPAHQLPLWFQQFSTVMVLAAEAILPWLIFGPRRLKQVAAFGLIGLQVLIILTGNYAFFNLLAIALCVLLLDDAFFAKKIREFTPRYPARADRTVSAVVITTILLLSLIGQAGMFGLSSEPMRAVSDAVSPFGIVNQYGLFAVMTTKRAEVEVEGTTDGQNWRPYVFRYKTGPLNRAPGWVAPFQPRLDWQMWFAALGNFRQNPWFVRFLISLLEGSRPVLALMESDPFEGRRPTQVRAMLYEYHFTTFSERMKTGNWWKREAKGIYLPAIGLRGGK
jgi:predicted DCC family thiol-disulfide oxidoreductase YuxK